MRIPEGVREVIGRRLNRLSQRCNETLTLAAVIGREFELRQLNKLIDDATEDMVLDVLEEGLSTRVIEELPTAVGRYQFTHALIQETLSAELSLTRRVRLHARIAETLEELYGDNVVHYLTFKTMANGWVLSWQCGTPLASMEKSTSLSPVSVRGPTRRAQRLRRISYVKERLTAHKD